MSKRIEIKECPYCGGTEFVKGWQYEIGRAHV